MGEGGIIGFIPHQFFGKFWTKFGPLLHNLDGFRKVLNVSRMKIWAAAMENLKHVPKAWEHFPKAFSFLVQDSPSPPPQYRDHVWK